MKKRRAIDRWKGICRSNCFYQLQVSIPGIGIKRSEDTNYNWLIKIARERVKKEPGSWAKVIDLQTGALKLWIEHRNGRSIRVKEKLP